MVMLVKLVKLVGDGSNKGNVGKIGKISNFGAVGDGSNKGNGLFHLISIHPLWMTVQGGILGLVQGVKH